MSDPKTLALNAVDSREAWLEARECYWAVVDAAPEGACNSPANRLVLDEIVERDVPEDLETLAVRYARVGSAAVACCVAAERVRLERDRGVLVLRPRALPAALRERLPDQASSEEIVRAMNFLLDEWEPPEISRLRRVRRRLWCAGLAASFLLAAGGFSLSAASHELRADAAERATRATLAAAQNSRVLGSEAEEWAEGLRREMAQLARTRGAEAARVRLRDASDALAALLRVWPADMETRVSSLQVNATQITLTVELAKTDDAEALSAALRGVAGWSLQPPRTEIGGGRARMTAVLRPASAAATTSASLGEVGS
ncbi:MAG TPA: hypothetical protein VF777_05080 [Phycisphaerales bacterium]